MKNFKRYLIVSVCTLGSVTSINASNPASIEYVNFTNSKSTNPDK